MVLARFFYPILGYAFYQFRKNGGQEEEDSRAERGEEWERTPLLPA